MLLCILKIHRLLQGQDLIHMLQESLLNFMRKNSFILLFFCAENVKIGFTVIISTFYKFY